MLRRSLVSGGNEARVSAAAPAALGDNCGLTLLGEIEQLLARGSVIDDRANGNREFNIEPVLPFAIAAFAVAPPLCGMFRVKAEVEQRIIVIARHHGHAATAAAVTAAGTAARHELFTPERQTAVAAVAGLYFDSYFIDKHVRKMKKGPRGYDRRPLVFFGRPEKRLSFRFDADELTQAAAVAKFDDAGEAGEQSVVLADADVLTRFVPGTALPNQNGSARDYFAAEPLDAQALRV
jgi:hypothetical protein